MTPEFRRPMPVAAVKPAGLAMTVSADAAERAALAQRFAVPAVLELNCRFRLTPDGHGGLLAEGALLARLERVCVVSLEPFTETVDERFALRFVPEAGDQDLDLEAPDEIPFSGTAVDLGEAAAEQLALAFDPWPRKPGARRPDAAEQDPPPRG